MAKVGIYPKVPLRQPTGIILKLEKYCLSKNTYSAAGSPEIPRIHKLFPKIIDRKITGIFFLSSNLIFQKLEIYKANFVF